MCDRDGLSFADGAVELDRGLATFVGKRVSGDRGCTRDSSDRTWIVDLQLEAVFSRIDFRGAVGSSDHCRRVSNGVVWADDSRMERDRISRCPNGHLFDRYGSKTLNQFVTF